MTDALNISKLEANKTEEKRCLYCREVLNQSLQASSQVVDLRMTSS